MITNAEVTQSLDWTGLYRVVSSSDQNYIIYRKLPYWSITHDVHMCGLF